MTNGAHYVIDIVAQRRGPPRLTAELVKPQRPRARHQPTTATAGACMLTPTCGSNVSVNRRKLRPRRAVGRAPREQFAIDPARKRGRVAQSGSVQHVAYHSGPVRIPDTTCELALDG